ncbi:MAG: type II toxin-antitoxin system HicA family toxin [SAR202 cluster bacterium]|nr:type II toxin-antitoxin system HicA family toxin [SAR202 cluster bacterium]
MPRRYTPAEAIKIPRSLGFVEAGHVGDHKQFKKPEKGSGKVTVRMKKG